MKPKERNISLDYLRGSIILLVVIFHVSISFMAKAPQWWYVKSDSVNILFTIFVVISDVFMMPVLFFIAGFVFSLHKRSTNTISLVYSRIKRLGIPWMICTLIVAPYLVMSMMISLGINVTYSHVISRYFWTGYYSQGPYWFLGILLTFSIFITILNKLSFVKNIIKGIPIIAIWSLLFSIPCIGYFAGSWSFGVDSWVNPLFIWSFQPSRILTYCIYFQAGYLLSERDWKVTKNPAFFGFSAIVLSVLFLILRGKTEAPDLSELFLLSITYSGLAFSMTFFLLAFFTKYVNVSNRVFSFLSLHSYVIYLVHLPLLIIVAKWIIYTPAPLFLRFFSILISVLALSLVFSFALKLLKSIRKSEDILLK